jgi:hypothetical protein
MTPRLPLTSNYWRVSAVRDEIVTVNRVRLNLSLLHRVLLARQVADLRRPQVGRVKEAAER